jgi:hypothetical protein
MVRKASSAAVTRPPSAHITLDTVCEGDSSPCPANRRLVPIIAQYGTTTRSFFLEFVPPQLQWSGHTFKPVLGSRDTLQQQTNLTCTILLAIRDNPPQQTSNWLARSLGGCRPPDPTATPTHLTTEPAGRDFPVGCWEHSGRPLRGGGGGLGRGGAWGRQPPKGQVLPVSAK